VGCSIRHQNQGIFGICGGFCPSFRRVSNHPINFQGMCSSIFSSGFSRDSRSHDSAVQRC
jgi:hypothetical protein